MKDKFTDEQIRGFFSGDYDHLTCKEFRELTRAEPEFSEGEVVAWTDGEGKQCYRRYNTSPNCFFNMAKQDFDHRPLTLTEHGKHVRDLRRFVDWVAAQGNLLERQRADYDYIIEAAKEDLARFDAAVKDD